MKKFIFIILLALIPVAVLIAVLSKICIEKHHVAIAEGGKFVIPYDFDNVRRVMVRTNAMQKMVESCGAAIIEQEITGINVATDKLLLGLKGNWLVEADGTFKVRMQGKQFDGVVPLKMHAQITPDRLVSHLKSTAVVKELQTYVCYTCLSRYGDQTLVDIRIYIDVAFLAPPIDKIDESVKLELSKSIKETILRTRQVLIEEMEKYKGRKHIFKLGPETLTFDNRKVFRR